MRKIIFLIGFMVIYQAHAQLRMVEGKVYDYYDQQWTIFNCNFQVMESDGADLICEPFQDTSYSVGYQKFKYHGVTTQTARTFSGAPIILRNFGAEAVGTVISPPVRAMLIGTKRVVRQMRTGGLIDAPMSMSTSYPIYDMGVEYFPPVKPLTPDQKKALEAKRKEMEIRTFKWIESQATNGDVSAQCDLGKHYLYGQGCETNKTLAIQWLTTAANQGDLEASNTLAKIR